MTTKVQPTLEMSCIVNHLHRSWWNVPNTVVVSKTIYFYSNTNQMHNISNLFYFGTTLYKFRTVFSSIIGSLRLYIKHHTTQVLWLLVSKQPQNLYDVYLKLLCTVLDSSWWMERPSETCTVFQNKINLRYWASGWFYYRNILLCIVLQASNLSKTIIITLF